MQVWNSFSLRKEKEKVVEEQVGYLRYFTKGCESIPQSLGFNLWTQISHEDVVMFWKKKGKKAKISSLSLVCGSIGWQHGYSISSAVVAELK